MKKGKSKSAVYYQNNPDARKVKAKKDREINARPEQRKKRSELVQARRDRGIYGKFDGKDVDKEWWKIQVEKDGNEFCCHGLDFVNLQESSNYAFGKTFEEAISNYEKLMLGASA